MYSAATMVSAEPERRRLNAPECGTNVLCPGKDRYSLARQGVNWNAAAVMTPSVPSLPAKI